MERKLASIQTITEILPHPNADKLEIAKILGWTAIVMKGEYKAGETVVYVETDAILPEGKEDWEFMRERHFKVKTIKLRGIISEGLVFHLSILPVKVKEHYESEGLDVTITGDWTVGEDVTELLGITKYEPYIPAQLAGIRKGNFPDFVHKTDETRIQAVPSVLDRHQLTQCYVTEKVDGSSMTAYVKDGEFGVCSRNFDMKETEDNAFWKVARALDLENKLRSFGKNIAVQGELVGPGVQKNKYGLTELNLLVFNVFNIETGLYYDFEDFLNVVRYLGLTTVPLVDSLKVLHQTVEELVEYSKGPSLLNPKTPREGVVFRPLINEFDFELHGRLSFKVINPEFLLKYDE